MLNNIASNSGAYSQDKISLIEILKNFHKNFNTRNPMNMILNINLKYLKVAYY